MPEVHNRDEVHKNVNNTNKSTYIKDSTYIRERRGSPLPTANASPYGGGEGRGCMDTLIIEHWHTEVRDSVVEAHDTLRIVERDSVPYPVEIPIEVEKPLPKWVGKTIAAFIIENLILVAVIVIRIRRRRWR